jgi:hypothetical protein
MEETIIIAEPVAQDLTPVEGTRIEDHFPYQYLENYNLFDINHLNGGEKAQLIRKIKFYIKIFPDEFHHMLPIVNNDDVDVVNLRRILEDIDYILSKTSQWTILKRLFYAFIDK